MNLRKRSYNHQDHRVSRTTEGLCSVYKHSSRDSEILLRDFGPINQIPRLSSGNRLEETVTLDIKCHTKKTMLDNSCTDLNATHINLSSMTSFEVKSYAMQKATTILTHLRKEIKISSLRNFQTEDAMKLGLCEAISRMRQHSIQEKTKSKTDIPLDFKIKYNPHFAGKHIKRLFLNT